MKNLYLIKNGEWKNFEYENIEDLKDVLTENNISISYSAEIGNYAEIGNSAEIGDNAKIGYSAKIGYYAKIGNNAEIGNYAKIGNNAEIGNKEIVLKSILINGSNHIVIFYFTDCIHIGCNKKSISEWKKEYKQVGKNAGYTESQILEYKNYILICEKLYKTNKVK